MIALLKKEIKQYFSSIVGYLVIAIFLVIVGLYMWIFGGEMNVFDNKTASLDTLFSIAPWVFLLLVPAITMRLFSEEKRIGTLELLLTKPISELKIVLAKYLAAELIVILALLPTLVYFISIQYFISNQMIDIGATIGSYIGLFFLAAIYNSIGLWASSLTQNQIVAFMLSISTIFFVFIGFDYISKIFSISAFSLIFDYISINTHYNSISRGIIDSKDIIYFLSLISFFIFLTNYNIKKR